VADGGVWSSGTGTEGGEESVSELHNIEELFGEEGLTERLTRSSKFGQSGAVSTVHRKWGKVKMWSARSGSGG
jgi:hypothetical protein